MEETLPLGQIRERLTLDDLSSVSLECQVKSETDRSFPTLDELADAIKVDKDSLGAICKRMYAHGLIDYDERTSRFLPSAPAPFAIRCIAARNSKLTLRQLLKRSRTTFADGAVWVERLVASGILVHDAVQETYAVPDHQRNELVKTG